MLMRKIFLLVNICILIGVLILWIVHDPFKLTYQVLVTLDYLDLTLLLGLDGISISFIYLTSFLVTLCNISVFSNKSTSGTYYIPSLFSILIILIFLFAVLDLFLFYIFFEAIILPFFIYMGINGYAKRRVHAAMLFFFYSFLGSIFLIIALFSVYLQSGSTSILDLYDLYLPFHYEAFIWILLFISIAIKVPMFPFHLWLPEAHVQASTEGSVLLAGVILKLSVYGLIRFIFPIFPYATYYFSPLVLLFATISVFYSVMTTLRQIDIKRIIAYSSITHMNFTIIGLFLFNYTSIMGALFMSLSHGLVSSALFFIVGMLYKRFHTKLIFYYRDLFTRLPIITFFFLLFTLGNIGFPLTCGFIGELLILIGVFVTKSYLIMVFCSIALFLTTVYSFILFDKLAFTQSTTLDSPFMLDIETSEFFIAVTLLLHVILFGIFPSLFFMLLQDFIFIY